MWTHYNMNNNKENHLLVSSLKMGTSFASRNLLSLLIMRNVVILMFLHFWNMWKIARFVINQDCYKILQRQSEVSIVLLLTCLRIFKDIYSELTEIYTWCDNYTYGLHCKLFISHSQTWVIWYCVLQIVHFRSLDRPKEDDFCLELWVLLFSSARFL